MQRFAAAAVVGAALLLSEAEACTYSERPLQVLTANDALTIPVQGKNGMMECATAASAFGMLAASISALCLLSLLDVCAWFT